MPDWKQWVREQVGGLQSDSERSQAIVEELAQHLEDSYEQAISDGASVDEAIRFAIHEAEQGPITLSSRIRVSSQRPGATLGCRRKLPLRIKASRGSFRH